MKEGIYAKIKTNQGDILLTLHYKKTPGTVANFVGLSEGKIDNSFKSKNEPFYDGIKFHRVIPDFMIQAGCPQGTGTGDPGYKFDDEFHPDLKHDKPGILSMANSGPNTNGSQFFITHIPTAWLDNKHTVFGEVIEGQNVVNDIKEDDIISSIEIIRIGEEAGSWDASFNFTEFKSKKENDLTDLIQKNKLSFEKSRNDHRIVTFHDSCNVARPQKGQNVSVHYKGMFTEGGVFDDSYKRGNPIEFPIGMGNVIPGWDEGILLLNKGDKARFVIPSQLAYGESGAGGVIPPNATLIFEVELL